MFGYDQTNPVEQQTRKDLEKLIEDFKYENRFNMISLLVIAEKKYSRAKFLDIGIKNCCHNELNSLIFLCDVDVYFEQNFLDQCRLNTIERKRAFFPILFSLYNPDKHLLNSNISVYSHSKSIIKLNKDSGYW